MTNILKITKCLANLIVESATNGLSKLVPARTLERDCCCPDEGGYEWTSKTVKLAECVGHVT